MTASEVYALSQGSKCTGDQECHWCGGPCTRVIQHDDPMTPIPAPRNPLRAVRPGNSYMCMGCWLWHRKSLTVHFLQGGYKDRQSPMAWSWLLTPQKSYVLTGQSAEALWGFILKPSHTFVLSLLDNLAGDKIGHSNLLHLAVANDIAVIKADTIFSFTVNGVPLNYSIYECQETVRINIETNQPNGTDGMSPGTRELVRLLGPPPIEIERHKKGRPLTKRTCDESIKRVIALSGQAQAS